MFKIVNGKKIEMTEGEILEYTEANKKDETTHVPPTLEEQVTALQNALITSKTSGGGYNNYNR